MAEFVFPVELQQSCGCPKELGRYPYRCQDHAASRMRLPRHGRGDWYDRNTCPFCGRVTAVDRYGRALCCDRVETCHLCGVASCDRHDMATYRLGITCPRNVNSRTKHGRALLKALAAWGAS